MCIYIPNSPSVSPISLNHVDIYAQGIHICNMYMHMPIYPSTMSIYILLYWYQYMQYVYIHICIYIYIYIYICVYISLYIPRYPISRKSDAVEGGILEAWRTREAKTQPRSYYKLFFPCCLGRFRVFGVKGL